METDLSDMIPFSCVAAGHASNCFIRGRMLILDGAERRGPGANYENMRIIAEAVSRR